MSYGVAVALQAAIYQVLVSDLVVTGLVGVNVFDELPSGTIPSTYVAIGPEVTLDRSDKTGTGAEHRVEIAVVSDVAGFATCKAVGVAISDALHQADLSLSRGHLVDLRFDRAVASREEAGTLRRLDLRFVARVDDGI